MTVESWQNERFSVLIVRVLLSEMRRRGLDERLLLEGTGVDASSLADVRATVGVLTWGTLLHRAIQITQDPALGIAIAEHWSQTKLQLLGPLLAASGTLREAHATFVRYKPLLGSRFGWTLEEHGERAYLFCDPVYYHPQITPVAFEAWLGAAVHFWRTLLGVSDEATEVWFKHERPDHHAEYARVFGGTLRFGQPRYAIAGPREFLDRELVLADSTTRVALERGAEQLLKGMQAPTTAERVRAVLWFERKLSAATNEEVAKRMGLGVRELRRRLAAEGVRLSRLLDEARLRIAQYTLSQPGVSIKEAAYGLGFSEPSAFFRAFKRWSGQTPLEYLRQLQHDSALGPGS